MFLILLKAMSSPAGVHVVVEGGVPHQAIAAVVSAHGRSDHEPEPRCAAGERRSREVAPGNRVSIVEADAIRGRAAHLDGKPAVIHPCAEEGHVRAHVLPRHPHQRDVVPGSDGL